MCIGVHAVFAAGAYDELRAAGTATVATTNSIPHASNDIDLAADLALAGSEVRGRNRQTRRSY